MGLLSRISGMFGAGRNRATKQAAALDFWRNRYASMQASYDAARTSDEYKNIWANADRFDADSAHSPQVRHTLIARSRYEINNNGYSDGIAQTYATDVVGVGPALRMQTGSENFNRMVENEWYRWTKAVNFRRKLWCLAHAKHSDGEGFGVLRRNPSVKHAVKLDLVLHEAEQFQSPQKTLDANHIDGLVVDNFGNEVYWEMLREHPGTVNRQSFDLVPERIPAEYVLHWYKMRRPGQHRAVPECASTLNAGAAARRWREATLAAAETAADFTMFMSTKMTAEDAAAPSAMSTLDINKRMMTALPDGYEPFQMSAEHPTASYEGFHKSLVNEQARPKSMPYNKAACDSSSYNYASGRLDHQTYYAALDVDREDCNDSVMDPAFAVWFNAAVVNFGWFGGDPRSITLPAHVWDWPKHRVADVESEANASQTKLKSGQAFHPQLFAEAGLDFEDELDKAATAYGVPTEELRRRLLDVVLPIPQQMIKPTDQKPLDQKPQVSAGWITLDNGVHIEIGDDGTIVSGPGHMRGKTMSQVKNDSDSGSWPTAQKSKSRAKVNIDRAATELEKHGFKLGKALPWKPGDKSTSYEITHKKTGKVHHKTSQEIKDFLFEDAPASIAGELLSDDTDDVSNRLNGHAFNGAAHG